MKDVRRAVGLSTASLASYHLGRLVELGYAEQDELGRYLATSQDSGEILEGYSKVGVNVVPQLFFFTLLLTVLSVFFSYEALTRAGYTFYLVAVALAMVAILWLQTAKLWSRLEG